MFEPKICVTGATGFVGAALCAALSQTVSVRAVVRSVNNVDLPPGVEIAEAELSSGNGSADALVGVTCVVHCAARVHIVKERSADPLAEFRRVNVFGTLQFARQAAASGVKRFVFLSSIKVNGESTPDNEPFRESDRPAPTDPYGTSKKEAEQGLRAIALETGMELVIIRPPLVYGPGVKANFLAMMRWLSRGVPLPLGAIYNKRSLVSLDNLVDFIATCIDHPAAANQTFLVSDDEDVSTTELLRRMGAALGRPARLLAVPAWFLETASVMLGQRDLSQRLCGNLQVDIGKAKHLLNWSPRESLDEGLRRTAKHFLAGLSK